MAQNNLQEFLPFMVDNARGERVFKYCIDGSEHTIIFGPLVGDYSYVIQEMTDRMEIIVWPFGDQFYPYEGTWNDGTVTLIDDELPPGMPRVLPRENLVRQIPDVQTVSPSVLPVSDRSPPLNRIA